MAKAERLKVKRGPSTGILPDREAGSILFETDTGKAYIDVDANSRVPLHKAKFEELDNSIQEINTELDELAQTVNNLSGYSTDAGPDQTGYDSVDDLPVPGTPGVFYLVKRAGGGLDQYFWNNSANGYTYGGSFGSSDTSGFAAANGNLTQGKVIIGDYNGAGTPNAIKASTIVAEHILTAANEITEGNILVSDGNRNIIDSQLNLADLRVIDDGDLDAID